MATSGTYTFGLSGGEVIEEAFERIGKAPSSLTADHMVSARRSLNLVLSHFETKMGNAQYRIDRITHTLSDGDRGFLLPIGTIDVIDAVISRATAGSTRKYPMTRITKYTYEQIGSELDSGLPVQYFISKELPTDAALIDDTLVSSAAGSWGPDVTLDTYPTDRLVLVIWPSTGQPDDQVIYHRLRHAQDVDVLADNVDVNRTWYEALVSGLATKLSVKWAPDRFKLVKELSDEAFIEAKQESRDRGPTIISGRGFGRAGRTRRI